MQINIIKAIKEHKDLVTVDTILKISKYLMAWQVAKWKDNNCKRWSWGGDPSKTHSAKQRWSSQIRSDYFESIVSRVVFSKKK